MLSFCILSPQRVMHKTFKAAFAGVENVLEEKLSVSYGLLTELLSRGVLSHRKVDDIKVCVYNLLQFNILLRNRVVK